MNLQESTPMDNGKLSNGLHVSGKSHTIVPQNSNKEYPAHGKGKYKN